MAIDETVIHKIVLIGPASVGKTSLCTRFISGVFNIKTKKTLGVDFALKNITLAEDEVPDQGLRKFTLQLWDFSGEERFRTVLPMYLAGTHVAFLSFDLTRPETLEVLPEWLEVFHRHLEKNTPVLLVGMKKDLKQIVSEEEIKKFQEKHNIEHYISTSSSTGSSINDAFHLAIKITLAKQLDK